MHFNIRPTLIKQIYCNTKIWNKSYLVFNKTQARLILLNWLLITCMDYKPIKFLWCECVYVTKFEKICLPCTQQQLRHTFHHRAIAVHINSQFKQVLVLYIVQAAFAEVCQSSTSASVVYKWLYLLLTSR